MTAREAVLLEAGNLVSESVHAARSCELARSLWSIPSFRAAQVASPYGGYGHNADVASPHTRRFYHPTTAVGATRHDGDIGQPIDYSREERHAPS